MSSLLFLVVVHLIMGTQGQRFADWAIIVPQHYLKLRNPIWRLKVPLPLNLELVIMLLWSVRYCHLIEFVVLSFCFLCWQDNKKEETFFQVLLAPEEKYVFMKISTCLGKENQHHLTMCHYTVIHVFNAGKMCFAQCENYIIFLIFLSLRFYVKSILAILEILNFHFDQFLRLWIL